MENAFVAIVPTRPDPLFGRPVHRRGRPHRFRPGASPHAFRIPPRGGHPALPGHCDWGQRGITPAFGYDALHPGARRTLTSRSTLLPGTPCGPLRLPGLPPSRGGGEGRDPSQPWVSRVALGSVPPCHAPSPGERLSGPGSVARAASRGLPGYSGRSALAASLSRPARASHVLRPVGLPIRPRRTHVPGASPSRLPLLGAPVATGVYRQLPRRDLHPRETSAFHGAPKNAG
jgi:hypothetical protein